MCYACTPKPATAATHALIATSTDLDLHRRRLHRGKAFRIGPALGAARIHIAPSVSGALTHSSRTSDRIFTKLNPDRQRLE